MENSIILGKHRNPIAPIFLSIITLGIYFYVWLYSLFNEARLYVQGRNGVKMTSGGAAVGFMFIPVFDVVWGIILCFKTPGLVTRMQEADGVPGDLRGSSGMLGFLMLIPFIGPLLWIPLTQNAMNSFWAEARQRRDEGIRKESLVG